MNEENTNIFNDDAAREAEILAQQDDFLDEPEEILPDDSTSEKKTKKRSSFSVAETDFTSNPSAKDDKRKKSSAAAAKTIGKSKTNEKVSFNSVNHLKYTFGVCCAGIMVKNQVRNMKLKHIKQRIEDLNSERTSLSNSHAGQSVSMIMNELKTKDEQRKAEKIEKKIQRTRRNIGVVVGVASVIGRTAGRRGVAEVVAEGSTEGASRSSLPTVDRTAAFEVPEASESEPQFSM